MAALVEILEGFVGSAGHAAMRSALAGVCRDAKGVLEGLREKLGREVVSSKGEQGLGLGLYLAHSVLRRLGGSVVFGPPGTVGTVVEIRLPLSSLLA